MIYIFKFPYPYLYLYLYLFILSFHIRSHPAGRAAAPLPFPNYSEGKQSEKISSPVSVSQT